MCRCFEKQESDSELAFDHIWRRSFKIGAVSVFETVRLVAYSEKEKARIFYFRGVALDEDMQMKFAGMHQRQKMPDPAAYMKTIAWAFLYLALCRILTKELSALDAESEAWWQEKWPFAADMFVSVRRERKLRQIGIS